ncbi:hypothetical protein Nepgr_019567 [Nepenthes gracilis]|uniref:Uncharacterized protein n=1 Tax=Nepenthes gracilis TaxID=150966 RepID=A0AAD3SVJ4_NEPGR|nr:hypothetical protein Nepgr_019567 [Nepenthes gracilis]
MTWPLPFFGLGTGGQFSWAFHEPDWIARVSPGLLRDTSMPAFRMPFVGLPIVAREAAELHCVLLNAWIARPHLEAAKMCQCTKIVQQPFHNQRVRKVPFNRPFSINTTQKRAQAHEKQEQTTTRMISTMQQHSTPAPRQNKLDSLSFQGFPPYQLPSAWIQDIKHAIENLGLVFNSTSINENTLKVALHYLPLQSKKKG